MIKIVVRALLFLAKKFTRHTFKKDFKSLDECLDYLNKNSYTKKKDILILLNLMMIDLLI